MYRPLPDGLTIKNSPIEGLGLFTNIDIKKNTFIGVTHIRDEQFENKYIRTPLGGFFNHSKKPNCEAVYFGDFIKLKTLMHINLDDEITVDYTKHNWIKKD